MFIWGHLWLNYLISPAPISISHCLEVERGYFQLNQTMPIQCLISGSEIPITRAIVLAGITKTSYLTAGEGYPVILIHGGGAGAVAWHSLINYLSDFFTVIAPDLVGYGESDKPVAFYDRKFFSNWLKKFINALGLDKCIIVGHSLGGAIAIQYTLDNPKLVERLVLVSSAGLGFSLPIMPLFHGLLMYSFPSQLTSKLLHSYLVYNPTTLDETFIQYASEVCQKPGGSHAFWHGCWKAVWPIPLKHLEKINQQTMMIWGLEDRVFPSTHARKALQSIPSSRLHVIPNAGHIPFFDQPKVFNNILLKFLEEQL